MPVLAVLTRRAARLGQDRRGRAAVEFAVILPILLAIWAGMTEVGHAIDEWRK
ncbi:pilus assembly protein TadE, partial [Methylobacterium radiotolerans]